MADKPKDFSTFRIERGVTKVCRCYGEPFLTLGCDARLVYCSICNAIIDPFDALRKLCDFQQRLINETEYNKKCVREALATRRRTVVFRELESTYIGKNKMYPLCPNCGEPFRFEDIAEHTHGEVAERRIVELQRREVSNDGSEKD
jgi:hypothetical protein